MTEATDRYSNIRILTSTKPKAIAMLHDKCFLLIATAQQTKELEKRRNLLNRAQNICSQLQSSLIISDDVAQGLFLLYDYCYILLERGEEKELDNGLQVMRVLKDTFNTLVQHPYITS